MTRSVLERLREVVEVDDEYNFMHCTTATSKDVRDAIAEIERLNARVADAVSDMNHYWEMSQKLEAEVAYLDAMHNAASGYLRAHGWAWDSIIAKYRAEHGDAGIPKFWIDKLDAALAKDQ